MNGKCGKKGKFADYLHKYLVLRDMTILALYCFRYLLYCIRSRLCTIVIYYILSSKFIPLMLGRVVLPMAPHTSLWLTLAAPSPRALRGSLFIVLLSFWIIVLSLKFVCLRGVFMIVVFMIIDIYNICMYVC